MGYGTSRFGDFESRTVGNAFKFSLSDMHPTNLFHGMVVVDECFYGFAHDETGKTYCLFQKWVGPLLGGTHLMDNTSGQLEVLPISHRAAKGEIKRTITLDQRRWENPLMQNLPRDAQREPDFPYSLVLEGDRFLLDQGELLRIEGVVEPLGVQFMSLSIDDPLFNTMNMYRIEGRILDKQVKGVLFMDRVHGKPGLDWKDSERFEKTNHGWHTFANVFEDGSAEYGGIINGAEGFNIGVIIDEGRCRVSDPFAKTTFEFAPDGYLSGAVAQVGAEQWRFQAADDGRMRGYSQARWAGYHSQMGTTRRVGDTRKVKQSFAWYESFQDRIEAAGLSATAKALQPA